MSSTTEITDARLVDLIRGRETMSIAEIGDACGVTATAVRQRLTRLMSQGLVERVTKRHGRGRPEHRYSVTEKARRQLGNNYADLAMVLWTELRQVRDDEVRRGLLQRVADQMTQLYRGQVQGATTTDRMESLRGLFADRRVPMTVSADGRSAALEVGDCPYPELAAQDRGVCAMEKMMIAELLETPVRLSQCRLDGDTCCRFEAGAGRAEMARPTAQEVQVRASVPESSFVAESGALQ